MSTRRSFLEGALLGGAFAAVTGALPARAQSRLEPMMRAAAELGARLSRGETTALEWQDTIGGVLNTLEPSQLMELLDVDALRERTPIARRGAAIVRLPVFDALGAEGAAMRLFFFEGDRGDPPHCHFNSVTAHVVLSGRFRVRHYERVRETPEGFVLRPSRDRFIEPGDVTSISELRDNAHWHHALTRGVLLDIEQGRLDPSIPIRRRQMLDLRAPVGDDGTLVAPAISRARAHRLYG